MVVGWRWIVGWVVVGWQWVGVVVGRGGCGW